MPALSSPIDIDRRAMRALTSFSERALVERRGKGGGGGGGGEGGGGGGSEGGGGGSGEGEGGGSGEGEGEGEGSGGSGSGEEGSGEEEAPPAYKSSEGTFKSSYGSESAYNEGGGSRELIPAGVPFSGRYYGGGTRDAVYGSRTYGSGYPYGGGGAWVAGRPFPFGLWPIYLGPHYYGGDEYGPENNSSRPGGPEMAAPITSNGTTYNTSDAYYIMGDSDSVRAVLDALVFNCSVVNSTVLPFSVSNQSMPQPQQAIQYYRASSFVLYADSYNNTAALPAHAPPSNDSTLSMADSPLPNLDASFLNCLNATIGASVPLADASAIAYTPQGAALAGLFWLLFMFFHNAF